MSGSKGRVVIEFNNLYSANAIWISYRLHILHIASITFDNITFKKINLPFRFFLYPYPFNILNLVYHLYCRYNKSNKDNPLNIKTKTINKLYMALMNYNLKRY